jgi:hypothetical protein
MSLMYCLLGILLYVAAVAVVVVSVRRFRENFKIWHGLLACAIGFPACSVLTLLLCDAWARSRIERYQRQLDAEIRERSNVVYDRVVLYQQPRDANFAGFYEWVKQIKDKYPEIDWHYKIDSLSEQQVAAILDRSIEDFKRLDEWFSCRWTADSQSAMSQGGYLSRELDTLSNLCTVKALWLARSGETQVAADLLMEMLNVCRDLSTGRDAVALIPAAGHMQRCAQDVAVVAGEMKDEAQLWRIMEGIERMRQCSIRFRDIIEISFLEEKRDILAQSASDSWFPDLRRLTLRWKPAKYCFTTFDLVALYETRSDEMARFDLEEEPVATGPPRLGDKELLSRRSVIEVSDLGWMATADATMRTTLDLLNLTCLVRVFQLRNGDLPGSLDELKAIQQSVRLLDPFSRNGRFHYSKGKNVFPWGNSAPYLLYSNGHNWIDDGGRIGGFDLGLWPTVTIRG